MKSDREIMRSVRAAIDDCTKGIDDAPSLQYRIARKAKGEEPKMKKLSASMILVIVLIIVSMAAAFAAGQGLFGEFSGLRNDESRLAELENVSENMETSVTAEDGVTVEIGQAYYEGDRVFVSYRLSGDLTQIELHEGAPEEDFQWKDVLENFIAADQLRADHPKVQQADEWLDGKGQRWAKIEMSFLADGIYLEDGTRTSIVDGDDIYQADGSLIGWRACAIPREKLSDPLTFKLILRCDRYVFFQDGNTLKSVVERLHSTDIPFTLRRDDRVTFLKGSGASDAWQAQASLVSSRIDVHGTVRLACPEAWINIWNTWENEQGLDTVCDWKLYQNGTPVEGYGTEGVQALDDRTLEFTLLFDRVEALEHLTLVPVYAQTGEHPEEAIRIEKAVE